MGGGVDEPERKKRERKVRKKQPRRNTVSCSRSTPQGVSSAEAAVALVPIAFPTQRTLCPPHPSNEAGRRD